MAIDADDASVALSGAGDTATSIRLVVLSAVIQGEYMNMFARS